MTQLKFSFTYWFCLIVLVTISPNATSGQSNQLTFKIAKAPCAQIMKVDSTISDSYVNLARYTFKGIKKRHAEKLRAMLQLRSGTPLYANPDSLCFIAKRFEGHNKFKLDKLKMGPDAIMRGGCYLIFEFGELE